MMLIVCLDHRLDSERPQAEETPVQSLALVLGNLCANLGVSITWLAWRR